MLRKPVSGYGDYGHSVVFVGYHKPLVSLIKSAGGNCIPPVSFGIYKARLAVIVCKPSTEPTPYNHRRRQRYGRNFYNAPALFSRFYIFNLLITHVDIMVQNRLIIGSADLSVFKFIKRTYRLRLPDKFVIIAAFELCLQQSPIGRAVFGILADEHLIVLLRLREQALLQTKIRRLPQ